MRGLLLVLAIGLSVLWVNGAPTTSATHVVLPQVAADMDITGNGPTNLAMLDRCGLIGTVGDTIQIDVTAIGIPAYESNPRAHGIVGFAFDLAYDPTVLQVMTMDTGFLLASTSPHTPFGDFGDPLPDTDGAFRIEFVDFSADAAESGDGVLVRLTLQAVGEGATAIDLTDTIEADDTPNLLGADGIPYTIARVSDAVITVGESATCESVDREGDGVPDLSDNCPAVPNASQADTDGDLHGDACDGDDDGDGWIDTEEKRWGSIPINAASVPENPYAYGRYFDVCLDGVDNDLDGVTDTAEAICGAASENPANDAFESALPITSGFDDHQFYLKATLQSGEWMPCGGIGHSLWYKFTPMADTTVEVRDWPSTALAAYTGSSLESLSLLTCEPSDYAPIRLQLQAAEPVYLQLARRDYYGLASPMWLYSNSDSDDVWDHEDNCPYIANPDQVDEDYDRLGNACDATPRHDIAVTSFEAPKLTLGADRQGVLRYRIRVENKEAHDKPL
ncbi:MAG: thrombospondin type 3 repeat-containing protein, partial [Dehalococcoidia bacterium]